MAINGKILVIWTICLVLIAASLSVKLTQSKIKVATIEAIDKSTNNESLATSQSFYEEPNQGSKTITDQSQNKSTDPNNQSVQLTTNIISAKAYLVGNVQTGRVYYEKNKNLVLPVASMSKLVTAIAATDKLKSDALITISAESAKTFPDQSRLQAGEVFTVKELLYPLLLSSSNVAAEALASTTNRAKFLELMSSYAWEIGMPDTYFADPSGLSAQNISTAEDFFALARYLHDSRPDLLALSRMMQFFVSTTTSHSSHQIVSTHPFVGDSDFIGGKTGHTEEAKDTMLTMIKIKGEPIAIVVLQSTDRRRDTSLLIEKFKQN